MSLRGNKGRVKGALFEILVESLLRSSGYDPIPDDGKHVRAGKIRGRGAWHQIDAFGAYHWGVPCIYQIRVISEAKCYSGNVGLPPVRNFFGAFKDISENYFVEKGGSSPNYVPAKRYTDTATMFSASGFTPEAEDFAHAQGIFLISYEDNVVLQPIIEAMIRLLDGIRLDSAAESITKFKAWIKSRMGEPGDYIRDDTSFARDDFDVLFKDFKGAREKIRTSFLGTATHLYPVHLLSEDEFPWHLFEDTDEARCKVRLTQLHQNCLVIEPSDSPETKFYVSIPRETIINYRDDMTLFKEQFFRHIDVPAKHRNVQRMLRFNLDRAWLQEVRSRRRPSE